MPPRTGNADQWSARQCRHGPGCVKLILGVIRRIVAERHALSVSAISAGRVGLIPKFTKLSADYLIGLIDEIEIAF